MSSLVSVRSPLVSAVGMTGLSEESVKSDGIDGGRLLLLSKEITHVRSERKLNKIT